MIFSFAFSNFGPVNEEVELSFEATSDRSLEEHYVAEMPDGHRILKAGMIYGPNASGKSTVLYALNFLRGLVVDPPEKKGDPVRLEPHQSDEAGKPTTFRIVFYANGIRYRYAVHLEPSAVRHEELWYYPNNRQALVYERVTDQDRSSIKFGSKIGLKKRQQELLEGNTIGNNLVLAAYARTNVAHPVLEEVYHWFENGILPIISPSTYLFAWTAEQIEQETFSKVQLIELLQKADLQITDFEITEKDIPLDDAMTQKLEQLPIPHETRTAIREKGALTAKDVLFTHEFEGEQGNKTNMQLSHRSESNGTQRYFGMAGPLLAAVNEDSFLLIDEMEASLHPDLVKHYLQTFLVNSERAQILFTSHHTALLTERDFFRNDVIWFTEKDAHGATHLYSAADFKTSELRKSSSVFNAYKLGKLGAKPNVSGFSVVE